MAYTVGDLVSKIQRRAKDTSFPATDIIEYLDDTQREVLGNQEYSFMEATETPTLSINDTTRAYPADHESTERIWLVDPVATTRVYRVKYLDPKEFFKRYPNPSGYAQGVPLHWTDQARTIYWSCPLVKAYTLRHQYLKKPTTLSDTGNVPVIPSEYEGILIYGALARVEQYRENFDIAAIHDRRKEDLAEDMALRYAVRQLGEVPDMGSPWGSQGADSPWGPRDEE